MANETGTAPFHGLWIPARLPGFWWRANYTQQPATYRAQGLRSDGRAWTLYPTDPRVGTSILNLSGTLADLGNATVVDDIMQRVGRVFRAECTPLSDCVGPLVGSLLFSEAGLSPAYMAYNLPPYKNDTPAMNYGNVSDLMPPTADMTPPLLAMGDPRQLYVDDNVTFR